MDEEVQSRSTNSDGQLAIVTTSSKEQTQSPPFTIAECDIKTKAIKCIANLAYDTNCSTIILKSGVGISILKLLERFNSYWNNKLKDKDAIINTDITSTSEREQMNNFLDCVKASVRAIRILSLESLCSEESKSHLIRFGAVNTIGNVLLFANNDSMKLDVVLCLKNLTDKMRLLPSDQIEEVRVFLINNFILTIKSV